jgi:gamma-glutamyl-gamma-aminobutyrate hydrolase PuuD
MFGICRGMQFLHAMNGGKLYQDVSNHCRDHQIIDVGSGEILTTSSMHHQMCIDDSSIIPIAYSYQHSSRVYRYMEDDMEVTLADGSVNELEAAFYPKLMSLGVQGHPEVAGYPLYTKWCLQRVEDLMIESESGDSRYATTETIPNNVETN